MVPRESTQLSSSIFPLAKTAAHSYNPITLRDAGVCKGNASSVMARFDNIKRGACVATLTVRWPVPESFFGRYHIFRERLKGWLVAFVIFAPN